VARPGAAAAARPVPQRRLSWPGPVPRRGARSCRDGASRAREAAPIRTGATCTNVCGGVTSSRAAPAPPPRAAIIPRWRTRVACPASSGRDPAAAPTPVNSSATVFVMLAARGGSPIASSAGWETTDARPTTVLITPAAPRPRPSPVTRQRSRDQASACSTQPRPPPPEPPRPAPHLGPIWPLRSCRAAIWPPSGLPQPAPGTPGFCACSPPAGIGSPVSDNGVPPPGTPLRGAARIDVPRRPGRRRRGRAAAAHARTAGPGPVRAVGLISGWRRHLRRAAASPPHRARRGPFRTQPRGRHHHYLGASGCSRSVRSPRG
jgi:hypothetical protein